MPEICGSDVPRQDADQLHGNQIRVPTVEKSNRRVVFYLNEKISMVDIYGVKDRTAKNLDTRESHYVLSRPLRLCFLFLF